MTSTPTALAQEVVDPDEAAVTAEFIVFLKDASARRERSGPIQRFNQGRAAGCVEAEFTVNADLANHYRLGLFATPATYRADIRFANASSASDRDKDVRGMSIALADVPGDNLTAGSSRQDFVLNSHPVMVAPDTREFMALLRATEEGGLARILYFARHPALARIGLAAQQHPTCHLDIRDLEHDALPVRAWPGREVLRQALLDAHQPDAGRSTQLSQRCAQGASGRGRCLLRLHGAVPGRQPADAD